MSEVNASAGNAKPDSRTSPPYAPAFMTTVTSANELRPLKRVTSLNLTVEPACNAFGSTTRLLRELPVDVMFLDAKSRARPVRGSMASVRHSKVSSASMSPAKSSPSSIGNEAPPDRTSFSLGFCFASASGSMVTCGRIPGSMVTETAVLTFSEPSIFPTTTLNM